MCPKSSSFSEVVKIEKRHIQDNALCDQIKEQVCGSKGSDK